jgi:muconolactone D-isomerase
VSAPARQEFLVEIEIGVPDGTDATAWSAAEAAERERGRELLAAGTIARIWRLPGRRANVGIWRAADATELHETLASLPMYPWMAVRVSPLARHPLETDD